MTLHYTLAEIIKNSFAIEYEGGLKNLNFHLLVSDIWLQSIQSTCWQHKSAQIAAQNCSTKWLQIAVQNAAQIAAQFQNI